MVIRAAMPQALRWFNEESASTVGLMCLGFTKVLLGDAAQLPDDHGCVSILSISSSVRILSATRLLRFSPRLCCCHKAKVLL
ncbi:hypothetical protein Nepgr_001608 [Nepenthes gracilis]|uniref:Uncharacterized protein n=1 Tax=Nepenthes gracilis TaxID=150966 RepID=A0AAD3P8I4_NEPGR|nr:hypothetical protein Nepgr_001608 [Nepenthes gracilis]